MAIETAAFHHTASIFALTVQCFVYRVVGIGLLAAGVRQVLQPTFTAREILGMQSAVL